MRVTIRLFARLRDLAGAGELVREVQPESTIAGVWQVLATELPALKDSERTLSVALNADYSKMSATVHDGDEVALLPPVSGE